MIESNHSRRERGRKDPELFIKFYDRKICYRQLPHRNKAHIERIIGWSQLFRKLEDQGGKIGPGLRLYMTHVFPSKKIIVIGTSRRSLNQEINTDDLKEERNITSRHTMKLKEQQDYERSIRAEDRKTLFFLFCFCFSFCPHITPSACLGPISCQHYDKPLVLPVVYVSNVIVKPRG